MITLKETPYLLFKQPYSSTKTKVVWVINIHHNETIGIIKWYSGWRQYCFFPNPNTIWNTDCLNAVTEMIKRLMDERKAVVKKEDYRVVGVVAWTIADFQNWRVLNGHHSKQGEKNTLRTYECKNTRYVCLSKPEHCCSWTFDEVVETDYAIKNDDYQEIWKIIKPCMKNRKAWIAVLGDFDNYFPACYELSEIYKGKNALPYFDTEEECKEWCDKNKYVAVSDSETTGLSPKNTEVSGMDVSNTKGSIFPSESDFYFKD